MSLLSVPVPEVSWILKLGRNQRPIDVSAIPSQTLRKDLAMSEMAPNFLHKPLEERRVPGTPRNGTNKVRMRCP